MLRLLKRFQEWRRRRKERRVAAITANAIADWERFGVSWCPICSYHRYGHTHGYDVGAPEHHKCPEQETKNDSA